MSSLSPSRPLIIMIIGHPGAGKSFFARRFAETFAAPIVGTDRLRHELFPEPYFSKEEDALIARIMSLEIRELLKTKKTFIIDGGVSTRATRTELTKIAKKAGYQTILIWIQTDPQTSMMRSIRRDPSKEGDEYNRSMPREVFATYSERFHPPSNQEVAVVISGKHTFPTQAKVVLKRLSSLSNQRPSTTTIPERKTNPPADPPKQSTTKHVPIT